MIEGSKTYKKLLVGTKYQFSAAEVPINRESRFGTFGPEWIKRIIVPMGFTHRSFGHSIALLFFFHLVIGFPELQ